MAALEIVDLRDRPQFAAQVAEWLYGEWYAHSGRTLPEVRQQLEGVEADHRFRATFVACIDGRAVGTFTLEPAADPATGLPLLCLSNLYVPPVGRGGSVGRRMCEHAVTQARRWRIPHLSLFTATHAAWYAAMGWQYVDVAPMIHRGRQEPAIRMRLRVGGEEPDRPPRTGRKAMTLPDVLRRTGRTRLPPAASAAALRPSTAEAARAAGPDC